MKYSMSDIKASLSHEKKMEDSLFAIYFHRPLSYPLTYLFANRGISAWSVSILSAGVAFIGCMLICSTSYLVRWIGIALINFWAILDCVDGNVARVTKTQSNKGAFMDAESGYIICAFVYLAFGMAAYHTSSDFIFAEKTMYIFVGAMASISDLLARLIHQKYVSTVEIFGNESEDEKQSVLRKLRKSVSTELGIAGFVLIGGILAQIFNLYNILVVFYGCFCSLTLLLTIIIYSKKAKRNNND